MGIVFLLLGFLVIFDQNYIIKQDGGEREIEKKVKKKDNLDHYRIILGIFSMILGIFCIINNIIY